MFLKGGKLTTEVLSVYLIKYFSHLLSEYHSSLLNCSCVENFCNERSLGNWAAFNKVFMFVFSAVYHIFVFLKTGRIRTAFMSSLLTAHMSQWPVTFHWGAEASEVQAAGLSFLRAGWKAWFCSAQSRWCSGQPRQVSWACPTYCLAGLLTLCQQLLGGESLHYTVRVDFITLVLLLYFCLLSSCVSQRKRE